MGRKFKPANKCLRIIYGDGKYLSEMDHTKKNPDKIFAVIGPFDSHADKMDLMNMLETIITGYNTEEK